MPLKFLAGAIFCVKIFKTPQQAKNRRATPHPGARGKVAFGEAASQRAENQSNHSAQSSKIESFDHTFAALKRPRKI
jgi:hypothetical protein